MKTPTDEHVEIAWGTAESVVPVEMEEAPPGRLLVRH